MISFLDDLLKEMSSFDAELAKIDSKKALFRIYRDTGFQKIKVLIKPISGLPWEWEKEVRKEAITFIWNPANLFWPEEFTCLNLRY